MTFDLFENLVMWVVTEKPHDYPQDFVARQWLGCKPTETILTAPTLPELVAQMPPGLSRYRRSATDHSVIVETWMKWPAS